MQLPPQTAAAAHDGRERRGAATRRVVVAAALELFAEHGCEGTTMRDIAERSGVKQPLIVYHFGSKEELWKAAVDEVWGRMESTLLERMAAAGVAVEDEQEGVEATRETLRVVLRSFLQSAAEHPEYLRILLREGSHRGPRFRWLVEHHTRRNYEAGIELFRRAQEQGLFPPVPTHHLLYLLAGALTFVLAIEADVQALTGRDPRSPAFLETHIDSLMALLGPGDAEEETCPSDATRSG